MSGGRGHLAHKKTASPERQAVSYANAKRVVLEFITYGKVSGLVFNFVVVGLRDIH